jgi:hypothetical protein
MAGSPRCKLLESRISTPPAQSRIAALLCGSQSLAFDYGTTVDYQVLENAWRAEPQFPYLRSP